MARRFFLFTMMLAFCMASAVGTHADQKASASPYTRAEIFLMRWEIVHEASSSPDVVRTAYHSMTVLRDDAEIAGLLTLLNAGGLHPASSPANRDGDFRLVVDLICSDGSKETFAAEYGRLVRLSDGASRPIDGAFRRRFSFSKSASQ